MSYLRLYIFVTKEERQMFGNDVVATLYIDPFTCEGDTDPYEFIEKIDNGSLISTGIWKSEKEMKAFKELCSEYGVRLHKCDFETANHSGCQSSCILRGDSKCTW